jgi:ketosteroid isomerase-like protein
MSAEENKRLIQRVFEELERGNAPAFIEVMADDVNWHVTGTTKFSKTYRGKAELMSELVGPLFGQLDGPLAMTGDRFIADGDYVVVEARGKATTKSGKSYNNKYCWVFRMEDGRIKEVTEYMDTQLVVTTFGESA